MLDYFFGAEEESWGNREVVLHDDAEHTTEDKWVDQEVLVKM